MWVARADARCADTRAEIDALPSARAAASPQERAEQVAAGTDAVEIMVLDLRRSAESLSSTTDGPGASDAELVRSWFEDWNTYIADRWAHVERLRAATSQTLDRDLRFLMSDIVQGGVYTERMDGFARANDMDRCQIPGDV